jgi:hypothetical protein
MVTVATGYVKGHPRGMILAETYVGIKEGVEGGAEDAV